MGSVLWLLNLRKFIGYHIFVFSRQVESKTCFNYGRFEHFIKYCTFGLCNQSCKMLREQGKGQWRVEGMVLACEYRVYLWISEIHATIVKSVSDTLGRNMQLRDLKKIVL